jgi:hypothetical protein
MKIIELFESEAQPMLFMILKKLLEDGEVSIDATSINPYRGIDERVTGQITDYSLKYAGFLKILVKVGPGDTAYRNAYLPWDDLDDMFTIEQRHGEHWLVNV